MPRFNTTSIPGYEDMTPEEKVAALEAFEYEDNSAEVERLKRAVTKANGEAAELKRNLNSRLTEDEQIKAAREEEINAIKTQNADLTRQLSILTHRTKLIGLGYTEALAAATAEAMADGDMEKVFANHKTFLDEHDKKLKADMLRNSPTPPAGNGTTAMTLEEFRKLDDSAKYAFSVEHPDEYKAMYGGK